MNACLAFALPSVDPDLADSDFLVTVTGTSNVDVPVTAETDLNLSLPNGAYTLTVYNPSFQDPPCTATYTFTIDCGKFQPICNDYTCSFGGRVANDKQKTPCSATAGGANTCSSDTLCCCGG